EEAAPGKEETNEDDPNAGKFGGQPEAHGRRLEARIEPLAGPDEALCQIYLTVRSTDPDRPLKGTVRFHLHTTFRAREEDALKVKGGRAKEEFPAWGRFTVGAEADDGATRLELNLRDVPGGTDAFYEN